jgi:hypothetical protein
VLEQLSGQTPVFSKGKFFFSFLFHFFGDGMLVAVFIVVWLGGGGGGGGGVKCEKVEGRF